MRRTALEGLERDAIEVDFSSRLSQLQIPVTFFVGSYHKSIFLCIIHYILI